MSTLTRLAAWKKSEVISDIQYSALSTLARKERFSVFLELNALLYLGVVSLAAGLAWTFKTYFTSLGDALILTILSAMLAGSLYYCFSRGAPYSPAEIESANFVLDYVLYLACLVLSVELGYIEFRFGLLKDAWDTYLLVSTAVFFFLAYRFDNRFVLSLALSSFAGWCGLRLSKFGFPSADTVRLFGLPYALIVAAIGTWFYRQGIKKHFFETYLHVAANVGFIAVLAGVNGPSSTVLYTLLLLGMSATAIVLGISQKRFAFVLYGTVYGYVGISSKVLRSIRDFSSELTYLVITGTIVIISMAVLARRFGREE